VNQTSEIQGLTTYTEIIVDGMATNSASLVWTSGTGSIQDNPPLTGSEAVQTTAYDENTVAVNGQTTYIKDFSINTGDRNLAQNNVESNRIVTYEGGEGGMIVSDENLLIDTAGNPQSTSGQYLCPFASSTLGDTIPAYCNIVQAGSHVESTFISFTTQASSRTVRATADVPVSLSYNINAHGISTSQGTYPAQGSVSAYIKAHIQEGRNAGLTKAEDLQYSESSSASGSISSFVKKYTYQSGANLL